MDKSIYFLFAGDDYYPSGGMEDYQGNFPTIEDAKEAFLNDKFDWGQIASWNGEEIVLLWVVDHDSSYEAGEWRRR